MHIAHIFSHGGLVGVSASGTDLVRELLRRGHKITLVHRPDAWISKQDFEGDITLVPMDMGVVLLNLRGIRALYRQFRETGVDVIHTHGSVADRIGGWMYLFGTIPTVAKAAARIKHIHWRFHDAVIAPSPYTVDWYRKTRLVAADRLNLVPNFLRADSVPETTPAARAAVRKTLGLSDKAFVLGSIGGIQPRKNQSAMVPIIRALRDRGIEAHAVLIGKLDKDEAPRTEALARDAHVQENIHLLGHRSDARALLAGFDAVVSTSHDEQASVVLLEGLAAARPLYFTNVGSAPSIIRNGENGLVFDIAQTAPLIDALENLARSPDLQDRISTANRAKFLAEFTPEAVLPKFESVYEKLAARR